MFDSKKMSKEIMETFNSLKTEEQNRILSNCGLSFQKKRKPSTKIAYRIQTSTTQSQEINTYESSQLKKELVHS